MPPTSPRGAADRAGLANRTRGRHTLAGVPTRPAIESDHANAARHTGVKKPHRVRLLHRVSGSPNPQRRRPAPGASVQAPATAGKRGESAPGRRAGDQIGQHARRRPGSRPACRRGRAGWLAWGTSCSSSSRPAPARNSTSSPSAPTWPGVVLVNGLVLTSAAQPESRTIGRAFRFWHRPTCPELQKLDRAGYRPLIPRQPRLLTITLPYHH